MGILAKLLFKFLIFSMRASIDNGLFEITWEGKTVFKGKADRISINRDITKGNSGSITVDFKEVSIYL